MNKQSYAFVILIIVLTLIVFSQTLNFDFINYDDDKLVYLNSKFLSSLTNIPKAFSQNVFGMQGRNTNFYRPMLLVSLIIDHQLWKIKPFGYHLTNLIIHISCSLLLFFLLKSIFNNYNLAFIGALIFAVHPVQTQSVAWIAGRNDVILGLFVLISVFFYWNYLKTQHLNYLIITIIGFLASLFTKEQGIFLIFVFPLMDWIYKSEKSKLKVKSRKTFYLLILTGFIFYLIVRIMVFGTIFGEPNYNIKNFSLRVSEFPFVFGKYIELIVYPMNLNLIHNEFDTISFVIAIIFLVLSLLVLIYIFKKNKLLCLGILWMYIFILPSTNLIPIPVSVLEHRLYVPMIGFTFVVVSILDKYFYKFKKLSAIIPGLLIIIYSFLSYQRLPVWKNSETLWHDVIRKNEKSDLAFYNLGTFYINENRFQEGIYNLEKALSINPNKSDLLMNLGYAYTKTDQYQNAINIYRKLLQLDPYSEQAYIGIGNSLRALKKFEEAEEIYKDGINKIPNSEKLHYELALCYGIMKKNESAESELKKSVQINKTYAPAYFSLGGLYSYLGKDSLAIRYIEEGLKYGQPAPGVYYVLSNSYLKIGDTSKFAYYQNLYYKMR